MTRDTSKRQTSGPGLTTRQTVEPPHNEMNQSAYAIVALQSIFRKLPEIVCAEDTGEGRNDNCWNGRQIGRCVCVCVCVRVCARACVCVRARECLAQNLSIV